MSVTTPDGSPTLVRGLISWISIPSLFLVPPSLTIWQAAAAPATHVFMLMGTLVMLPIILGYMIFVYWILGGKVREGEGYH
jgi:cytochrome bd-type quinol oxidase subunit 2